MKRRSPIRPGQTVRLWSGADQMHNGRRGSKRQEAPADLFVPGTEVIALRPAWEHRRWEVRFPNDPNPNRIFILGRGALLTEADIANGYE